MMFKLIIILIIVTILMPIYAWAGSGLEAGAISCSFSEWANSQPVGKPIDENVEDMLVREQWERGLGIDIFYPYFKAKEVESKLKQKASIKVFKMKGNLEFKKNEAIYTFDTKF